MFIDIKFLPEKVYVMARTINWKNVVHKQIYGTRKLSSCSNECTHIKDLILLPLSPIPHFPLPHIPDSLSPNLVSPFPIQLDAEGRFPCHIPSTSSIPTVAGEIFFVLFLTPMSNKFQPHIHTEPCFSFPISLRWPPKNSLIDEYQRSGE